MGWTYRHEGGRDCFLRRVPPAVGITTLALMTPLGILGLRAGGHATGVAVAGGAALAFLTALALHLFLVSECKTRIHVEMYMWGRLRWALGGAVVVTLLARFVVGLPWLLALALGPLASLVVLAVAVFVISQL